MANDKGKKIEIPHLASIVNPSLRKEKSISNMETLPGAGMRQHMMGPMTTADSAKSGRLKVDAKGMKARKKIMQKAAQKAIK